MQEVVGQLLIAQLQQTFLARDYLQGLPVFPPYFLYIDEFQKYAGHSEESLIEILNGLRKFKIGITMAHQTTANISPRLRSTILGNVGIIGCLQISAEEASVFARELQLYETVQDRHGSDVAEVEEAIGRERRRLAELEAPSSHLFDSLQSELMRARKAELLQEHSEPKRTLRPDLLQNLELG